MIVEKMIVKNRLGLHARPSAKLTQKTNEFLSEIRFRKGDRVVNGKSIMGVMLLAASQGCELEMTADGTDEKEAVAEVRQLFESGFGEE